MIYSITVHFLQVNLKFLKLHYPCLIFQAKKQKSEDIGISSISEAQVIIYITYMSAWRGACSYIMLQIEDFLSLGKLLWLVEPNFYFSQIWRP